MRLLFEVCHAGVFCPVRGKRDSVARAPMVTIRSATATNAMRPITIEKRFPRAATLRANLNKVSAPDASYRPTALGPILQQLRIDRKDNRKEACRSAGIDNSPPLGSVTGRKGCLFSNRNFSLPKGLICT